MDLTPALIESGVKVTRIGNFEKSPLERLCGSWSAFGSGISAFPSVHVAMAVVTSLYLAERSRWLAPVGIAFVAIILFMSVYSGFHYAIDGYASILVVATAYGLERHYGVARSAISRTFRDVDPVAQPI